MKKITILTILLLSTLFSFSQNKKTIKLLNSIQNKWELNTDGNVEYVKILDSLPNQKTVNYQTVIDYIMSNYKNPSEVIQIKDVESGVIVYKGLFNRVGRGQAGMSTKYNVNAYHLVKVELKENRARITISPNEYFVQSTNTSNYRINISGTYPLNKKGKYKNIFGNAFYNSHKKCLDLINDIESSLKLVAKEW